MRMLKFLSHPGFFLFGLSAAYGIVRGPVTGRRELLSMLLATAFGVGEFTVAATALGRGWTVRQIGPRLLNALGALTMAASHFGHETVVSTIGALILTAGLLWWTAELRRSRPSEP